MSDSAVYALMEHHSERSASVGLTEAARRAGMKLARSADAAKNDRDGGQSGHIPALYAKEQRSQKHGDGERGKEAHDDSENGELFPASLRTSR